MRLGEMLVARQQITTEDLERALEIQKERGEKLGKILVDLGFISTRDVLAALSDQLGLPLVSIEGPPPVSPELERLSARAERLDRNARDGRPARFRDHRGRALGHRFTSADCDCARR
jgi:hypothetical protein